MIEGNSILLLRHSERKNQSTDNDEKSSWIKSKRFKMNQFDVPLSQNGLNISQNILDQSLKKYKGEFSFIYSSPYTRCIQTSLQFQKYIKVNFGVKPLIRIEYGIVPNFYGEVDSLFFGTNNNVKIRNNKVEIIKPIEYVDEYLSTENIIKKYGKSHFDIEYVSICTREQINNENFLKPQEICSNRINTFIKLSKILDDDSLNLIVTHGEIISLINAWLSDFWNPDKGFNLCGGLELKLTKKGYEIIKEIEGHK